MAKENTNFGCLDVEQVTGELSTQMEDLTQEEIGAAHKEFTSKARQIDDTIAVLFSSVSEGHVDRVMAHWSQLREDLEALHTMALKPALATRSREVRGRLIELKQHIQNLYGEIEKYGEANDLRADDPNRIAQANKAYTRKS